jgi:tRNA (cmo5U34)-methyltransferase
MSRMEIPTDWTFKSINVAEGFDRHVREQLPFYELVSGAVAHIARHYLREDGTYYDIGASTGNLSKLLQDTCQRRNVTVIGIDNSPQMRSLYDGYGSIEIADCTNYPYRSFDVATLFLTLMFIPVEKRVPLLEELYENLREGGALIVVDKEESEGGYTGTIFRRLTLAGKVATGTKAEEIITKELSLAGVQRAITTDVFPVRPVEFFRYGEFVGWILEK